MPPGRAARQQGGLARAGAAADQEGQARAATTGRSSSAPRRGQRPRVDQLVEGETRRRGTRSERTVPGRARPARARRGSGCRRPAAGRRRARRRRGDGRPRPPAAGRAAARARRRGSRTPVSSRPGARSSQTWSAPLTRTSVTPSQPQQRLERAGPDHVARAARRGRRAPSRRRPGRPCSRRASATSWGVSGAGVARKPLAHAVEELGPGHALRAHAAAGSSTDPAGPRRARSAPRRDRAGPSAEVDGLVEPALVGHRDEQRDLGAAGSPTRGATPPAARASPDAAADHRPAAGWTSRAAEATPATVGRDHERRGGRSATPSPRPRRRGVAAGRPPRRRARARRPRAPRGPRTAAAEPGGPAGQVSTREADPPRQRLAQRPRAEPTRSSVRASPTGPRRPPRGRGRGRDRRRAGRRRRGASAATRPRPGQRRGEHRRSGTSGAADHADGHARVAAPSPTSVSSSTSQVSEAGRPATVSAPTPTASRNSPSPTGARPSTCTPERRGGPTAARSPAASAPTRTTGAAAQRRRAAAGSGATSGATPAAAESRCTSSTSSGSAETRSGAAAVAAGTSITPTNLRRRHDRLPPTPYPCGHSLSGTALWTRNGQPAVPVRPFCLPSRHESGGPPDCGVLRSRQDDHRQVEHVGVQPRVPGRRADLAGSRAALGVRAVRLPRRRRRPRPDGEDAAVHVAAVRRLGRADRQGDRRATPCTTSSTPWSTTRR